MIDADEQFTICYQQGRRAARTGLPVTSNPHIDNASPDVSAWVEGYHSVDLTTLTLSDRFRIFQHGKNAAANGESVSACPYLDDDPEIMDLWLLGYAPQVEDLSPK